MLWNAASVESGCLILFPAYIAAIWIPAFVYRRTALGFAIAALGPASVMLLAWLVSATMPSAGLMSTPWWLSIYGMISAAIGAGAVLLACAPRRALPHECLSCQYDLRGNVTGVCPECGAVTDEARLPGDDLRPETASASDGRADPQAA
jgi:hypothetical protein